MYLPSLRLPTIANSPPTGTQSVRVRTWKSSWSRISSAAPTWTPPDPHNTHCTSSPRKGEQRAGFWASCTDISSANSSFSSFSLIGVVHFKNISEVEKTSGTKNWATLWYHAYVCSVVLRELRVDQKKLFSRPFICISFSLLISFTLCLQYKVLTGENKKVP